ncbi:MAG: stage III sporulation AC/AD family protein, partial [Ruminococcus sp.]|nr:stage III sporulation AC/AD family protein [Ruminococcus sp.]
ASDICKDCGENTLAVQAEIAGKIALMLLALPLFGTLAELISELI